MALEVRLYAGLAERAGRRELLVPGLGPGTTVLEAKAELLRLHPELGSLQHVRGVLGQRYVDDRQAIAAGEVLHLLPPVSGGQGPEAPPPEAVDDRDLERGRFRLQAGPLDPGLAWREVAHPSCGALVVFSGHTRDTNRQGAVLRLDYEAFEAMAAPEMGRIFGDTLARFGPASTATSTTPAPPGEGPTLDRRLRMLVVHRTGVVEVGEASVLVAVASPHRAAAFDACRHLIDTLKERLPVWKKEVYRGGSTWINDRS